MVLNGLAYELGTPDLEPPTIPLDQNAQVRMIGELPGHDFTAAHATKWGDVWMAFGIGGHLMRMDAPWKGK